MLGFIVSSLQEKFSPLVAYHRIHIRGLEHPAAWSETVSIIIQSQWKLRGGNPLTTEPVAPSSFFEGTDAGSTFIQSHELSDDIMVAIWKRLESTLFIVLTDLDGNTLAAEHLLNLMISRLTKRYEVASWTVAGAKEVPQ
eukprot:TRINITY_DN32218_c0_g1_i1.p1 TRINITY_DN32218_c0_g1~~TRINITY_DN32218_c0_g1_i1.p1  ORF type:complete len:140 (+),score=36.54 TRINITY_DN32218_c0_g1_i1:54-473(+)